MRSSDWSSDVCSSDLEPRVPGDAQASLGSCLRRSTSQGLPMTASTPTIDAAEAAHFGALAADWWNPSGASAMLHRLNPARLGYIREQVDRHWGGDGQGFTPLAGRTALDVGCGAGLLAGPRPEARRVGKEG